MSDDQGRSPPAAAQERFGPGLDDAIIMPLVALAFAVRRLLRALLTLLIHLLDWAFPILLQLMRFPLFTLRIAGDGIAALMRGIVRLLPVSGAKREAWRELVSRHWAWIREKISYKAFEEALHHAFEAGMAWVFKRCKDLSPGAACLVLIGAVIWLPVSFGVATAMHAVLIAKAASWPAWTQLLHPVATVIAKSKLLVLPVYPAAWPQAKVHPAMQALFAFGRYLASLRFVRKAAWRYRQVEHGAALAAEVLGRHAVLDVLGDAFAAFLRVFNRAAAKLGGILRAAALGLAGILARTPGVSTLLRRYAEHYEAAERGRPPEKASERMRGFFERWSIKFTPAYYEAKDAAADRHAP